MGMGKAIEQDGRHELLVFTDFPLILRDLPVFYRASWPWPVGNISTGHAPRDTSAPTPGAAPGAGTCNAQTTLPLLSERDCCCSFRIFSPLLSLGRDFWPGQSVYYLQGVLHVSSSEQGLSTLGSNPQGEINSAHMVVTRRGLCFRLCF